MIIDAILDRKACPQADCLDTKEVLYILNEAKFNDFEYITDAFLSGNNEEVQIALCKYIDEQEYNPHLKRYVCETRWI